MKLRRLESVIGRAVPIFLVAVVAACAALLPAVQATAQRRTIPVMIQTVPALPGIRFSLDGKIVRADENGLALTVVPEPGTYNLRVVSKQLTRDEDQFRFAMWSDKKVSATRIVDVRSFTYLQAGFQRRRLVSFSYVGRNGDAVAPRQVDSISVTSPEEGKTTLSGPGPYRLVATTPVRNGANLQQQEITYRVEEVLVDGSNVLGDAVSLSPSTTGDLRLQLAAPRESAGPQGTERGPRDSAPALPPGLLIALLSVGAGILLLIVARRVDAGAAIKAGAARAWAVSKDGARRMNPAPAIAAGTRRLNPAPALRAARQRLNVLPAVKGTARRLNPVPPLVAGVRRLDPRPAFALLGKEIRRLNPKPRLVAGIESIKTRAATKPKSARATRSAVRARPPAQKADPTAPIEPRPDAKAAPAGDRAARGSADVRVRARSRRTQTGRGTTAAEGLGASAARFFAKLKIGHGITAKFRNRKLRAQLSELHRSGQGVAAGQGKNLRSFTESKKKRRVPLLWLRGSPSPGSMRDYPRGPRVRIKLRNGHLVVGTIRRTQSHVDQDALNIFVERVYDEFGNETVNSPEDSFILPSQIVRIERADEEEHRVIRLPEPEDRVIRLPDSEDRIIRLPEAEDQVTSNTKPRSPSDTDDKKADGG